MIAAQIAEVQLRRKHAVDHRHVAAALQGQLGTAGGCAEQAKFEVVIAAGGLAVVVQATLVGEGGALRYRQAFGDQRQLAQRDEQQGRQVAGECRHGHAGSR